MYFLIADAVIIRPDDTLSVASPGTVKKKGKEGYSRSVDPPVSTLISVFDNDRQVIADILHSPVSRAGRLLVKINYAAIPYGIIYRSFSAMKKAGGHGDPPLQLFNTSGFWIWPQTVGALPELQIRCA